MTISKQLIVIRLSSLGDVAMLVPVFLSFHKQFPDMRIQLISRRRFQPIFDSMDFVEFIAIDKESTPLSFAQLLSFFWNFQNKKNGIILDLHDVIRTKILRSLFRVYGNSVYRINKGREEKKRLTAFREKKIYPLPTTMERYRHVFSKSGFKFSLDKSLFLNKKRKTSSETWIGVAPFAKFKSKELGLDNMKSILKSISEWDNVKIFIFGYGSEEYEKSRQLAEGLEHIELVIRSRSFEEELTLISQLDVMLSMDSGNGHLAANYGIPVVTIWGTTHPYLGFTPYAQPLDYAMLPVSERYPLLPTSVFGNNQIDQYDNAINSINLEDVVKTIQYIVIK